MSLWTKGTTKGEGQGEDCRRGYGGGRGRLILSSDMLSMSKLLQASYNSAVSRVTKTFLS